MARPKTMKAVLYHADWDPKPGLKLSEKELRDHRGKADSDKIFRNPTIKMVEMPVPEITKPDEVLIMVKACGICGTDLHLIETDEEGYNLYPGHMKGDMVLGHEFCGEVIEVGTDVVTLKVGDKVAVEEMKWCGRCYSCRKGHVNQCTNLEEFGITAHGAYSEYVVSSERYCWKINSFSNMCRRPWIYTCCDKHTLDINIYIYFCTHWFSYFNRSTYNCHVLLVMNKGVIF